jgi:hypothetical protein
MWVCYPSPGKLVIQAKCTVWSRLLCYESRKSAMTAYEQGKRYLHKPQKIKTKLRVFSFCCVCCAFKYFISDTTGRISIEYGIYCLIGTSRVTSVSVRISQSTQPNVAAECLAFLQQRSPVQISIWRFTFLVIFSFPPGKLQDSITLN